MEPDELQTRHRRAGDGSNWPNISSDLLSNLSPMSPGGMDRL